MSNQTSWLHHIVMSSETSRDKDLVLFAAHIFPCAEDWQAMRPAAALAEELGWSAHRLAETVCGAAERGWLQYELMDRHDMVVLVLQMTVPARAQFHPMPEEHVVGEAPQRTLEEGPETETELTSEERLEETRGEFRFRAKNELIRNAFEWREGRGD